MIFTLRKNEEPESIAGVEPLEVNPPAIIIDEATNE